MQRVLASEDGSTSVQTLRALVSASRAIVRVTSRTGSCTGWAITPRLVVSFDLPDERLEVTLDAGADKARTVRGTRVPLGEQLMLVRAPSLRRKPLALAPASRGASAHLLGHTATEGLRALVASRILAVDGEQIRYESTLGFGSSGAPLLDDEGRVAGVHVGRLEQGAGYGLAVEALLARLRACPFWDEIRIAHGISDRQRLMGQLARAEQAQARGPSPARRALRKSACVLWSFDPGALRPYGEGGDASALVELGDDVDVASKRGGPIRWALKESARREAIAELATPEALRAARAANPHEPSTAEQALLDRVLEGRVDLGALGTTELARLGRIVDWLPEGLARELAVPDRQALEARMARQRLRETLAHLTGGFQGREDAIARLQSFLSDSDKRKPLVVSGPGGVGKSSLIARLLLDRLDAGDAYQLFAYVDFDRADVHPHAPASVVREIVRQLAHQSPAIAAILPSILLMIDRSREVAASLARALRGEGRSPGRDGILVVLDTFEEAQYLAAQELEPLYRAISDLQDEWPSLRVIVSGRDGDLDPAAIEGAPTEPLALGGLDAVAGRALLASLGVDDPATSDALMKLTRGMPLGLRLAAELIARGGDAAIEVEEGASDALVQGLLYQRILDHVHDERVARLAHPGLVLRRVTPEVIGSVLAGPCELGSPDGGSLDEEQARELFDLLARETFLVSADDDGALRHRADVRAVMLSLIEHAERDKVRAIDDAAVRYYEKQEGMTARAEELYHRLRRGDDASVLDARWLPGVEEGLGAQLGMAGRALRRYKAGGPPPDQHVVEVIAAAAVRRAFLGRAWLQVFLQAARYPGPEALLARLVGGAPILAPLSGAPPSGTVTFLFTDIVGSTRIWEQQAGAMQRALARHDALLRQAITTHGGHIFKTVGDAFCAAFTTAPAAVGAALSIQRLVLFEPWSASGLDAPIQVRTVLHTGAA
ncbi:MAG: AAA family ATPase, partial [Sandaracinaceae bacterium]|nr:AAA family ATPase [Sandaracinaceae bacterium]